MIKKLYLYVQFYFFKLFTSQYKVKGKCNSCGACCRNIVFMIGEEYVKTEQQFESLQNFDKKYHHFEINGKNNNGVILFRCKSLDNNNKCRDYFFRSINCRQYPKVTNKIRLGGFETFDTCGYEISTDKNFSAFLK